MYKTFRESYAIVNREVCTILSDVRFSGSTCVGVLTYGRKLFIANVGDSRAILVKFQNEAI